MQQLVKKYFFKILSPLHLGGALSQIPLERHVIVLFPIRLYPVEHLKDKLFR